MKNLVLYSVGLVGAIASCIAVVWMWPQNLIGCVIFGGMLGWYGTVLLGGRKK